MMTDGTSAHEQGPDHLDAPGVGDKAQPELLRGFGVGERQFHFLAQRAAERFQCAGSVVLAAVEAPVDDALDALIERRLLRDGSPGGFLMRVTLPNRAR